MLTRELLMVLLLALAGWSQSEPTSTKLELHKPLVRDTFVGDTVARDNGSGLVEAFTLDATAGQFVSVSIRNLGEHATVSLTTPESKESFHLLNDGSGTVTIPWIARRSGRFVISVSQGVTAKKLSYEIEWKELRAPNSSDFQRVDAQHLLGLGDAALGSGEYERALGYFAQALPIFAAAGDRTGKAFTLFGAGLTCVALEQASQALEYLLQALPLFHEFGNQETEADIVGMIASSYSRLGDNQKALRYYLQQLAILRPQSSNLSQIQSQNAAVTEANIGRIYEQFGEREEALKAYEQSLLISRSLRGDARGITEAGTYNLLGLTYSNLGQYQTALKFLNEALELDRTLKSVVGEAATLINIGYVYFCLADYHTALDYQLSALPLVGNSAKRAKLLNSIGVTHLQMGNSEKALVVLNQAAGFDLSKDPETQGVLLTNIGFAYRRLSADPYKTLDYFNRALPLLHQMHSALEGTLLINIGDVYLALGENNKALEYFNRALPKERENGHREGEAATLYRLQLMFTNSAPELAALFGKQAVNVVQSVRRDNRELTPELIGGYQKSIEDCYRDLASLLIGNSRFSEAEEILNLLKDREAADYLRRDHVKLATLLPFEKEALRAYNEKVNQMVAIERRRAELSLKAGQGLSAKEQAEFDNLDSTVDTAAVALNRFLLDEQINFSDASAPHDIGFVDRADLQEVNYAWLEPHMAVIYTLVSENEYKAVLTKADGHDKSYVTKIKRDDLNQKLFQFHAALKNPKSDPAPMAQEMYRILFPGDLRKDLDSAGITTLLWSLDGGLRYIPVGALHDGQGYLAQHFANSIGGRLMLSAQITAANSRSWQGAGFGVSEPHPPFARLPAVGEELHRIFSEQPSQAVPLTGKTRLNGEFNLISLREDLIGQHRSIVHIASHFDAEPGEAANSHLLLGDGKLLSLAEIQAETELFKGVDLVTLSACETGFGATRGSGIADGREVDSLGDVAQLLGAKSVIASLWSVSDRPTAILMQQFYRTWKEHPELGKSEALRRTQAEMATGLLGPSSAARTARRQIGDSSDTATGDWSHPYYWAPFILMGNVE